MPLPTVTETWTFDLNNRITYSSVNQVMSELLYGIKVFLTANGYTIKGSCNGATGAMDAVDRWASAANCTTRGANASAAQSWIVLVDGQGVDILLAYQGASDDIARISFSDNALFVAAGTATFQPTATDESVLCTATSLIAVTASADRLWDGWVNADSTMFRILVIRSNTAICAFGIEKYIPVYDPILRVGKSFGHFNLGTQLISTSGLGATDITGIASTRGGIVRYNTGSTSTVVGACFTLGVSGNETTAFGTQFPIAQGATAHILCEMYISSTTSPLRGLIGKRIDWWYSFNNSNGVLGDFYGSSQFVVLSASTATTTGGVLWPWDGASSLTTA